MKALLENIQIFIVAHKWLVILSTVAFLVIIVILMTTIPKILNTPDKLGNGGPEIGRAENTQKAKSPQSISESHATLAACPSGKELFTTFPVKEGDYTAIVPLGNLNPSGHTFPTDHLYVEIHDPRNPAEIIKTSGRKALIAPADMWIVGIQKSEQVGGITDWAMDFSPCRDVKGKFGHVGTISTKLQAEIDKVKANCNEYETGGHKYRQCQYNDLKLQVRAGEEIGTAGSERSGMLDIWMSDYREPQVKRANPARWSSDRNYVSCFLDYYNIAQKNSFYDLLRGPWGGKRTKEPRCGTVDVDIVGTAQGIWFYNLSGQVQNEDPHLALVFDNMETENQVFSVGNSATNAGIPSGAYNFIPKSSGMINRDFSQVTADGLVYCYETNNNRDAGNKKILLSMPSAEKLYLEGSSGSCGIGPWTMTNYVEFAR